MLLTLEQAARRLGVGDDGRPVVSVRTLEREAAAGRLAIIRIRSRRLVELAELDRYVAAQRCQSASTAIGGKSASAWEAVNALNARFLRAQADVMRSNSRPRSAARRSTLRLVARSDT